MRKIIFICLFCIFTLGTGMCACAEISANPIDPNKPFALTETEWLSLRESELGFLWQTEGLQDDNTSGLLKMSTFVESNNKFYYVDQENHTVNSIEFDGSNPQVLVNENDYIEGIIVTEQYLYVKYGYEYTRLVQYSLDGQDGCLLVAAETIDSLYFCNGMLYFLVGSSDTFCGAIKKESEAVPMGVGEIEILDSQEDAIYYMDHNGDLKRMNMDGTDQEILVSGGPYGFWIGIWDDKAHSFYDEKEWDSEIKF